MPTIQQLPLAAAVAAGDVVPVSQAGALRSVMVGSLLASTQPAIMAPTGTILGRMSAGVGGPEPIGIGVGLVLSGGTLATAGLPNAPQVSSVSATDLVCISHNGTLQTVSYSQFLDGETIDVAQPATAASDTDTLWVAQGNSTMLRQTLAAIWAWIATKLPGYKLPVLEIATDTTLDGTVHNGRLLICTRPVTLSPAFINMGSGFACEIVNLSGGAVSFAAGVSSSSGSSTLLAGQSALLRAASYSGGNVVFASIFGSTGSGAAVPGAVVNLATSNITSSSVGLTWSAPSAGGMPSGYVVQYRQSGSTSWLVSSSGVAAPSFTVTGLAAGTGYDFQVTATNGGGSGPGSMVSASTAAGTISVTTVIWNVPPSGSYAHGNGSIGVNAHITPATAPVQFGFSTSAGTPPLSWTVGVNVNSDLWGAYVPTPSTAGSWYAWCEGTDGSTPTVYPTTFTVS